MDAKKIWNQVKPFVPYVIIGGIVIWAGSSLWKKLFSGGNPNEQQSQQTVQTAQDEIKKQTDAGEKPTYSDEQFNTYADGLEQAMAGIGTDTDAVYHIFGMMNSDLDLLKLTTAFGLRDYQFLLSDLGKLNLAEWIHQELSSNEITHLNSILFNQGISYQF
jgi:hypothetical protein